MRRLCVRRQTDDHSESFRLQPGANGIGSLPDNQVVLTDSGVSRYHAVLEVTGNELMLEDRASKNGSFVNGSRVRRQQIEVGDLLGFGDSRLRVDELDPEDDELAIELVPAAPIAAEIGPVVETTRLCGYRGSPEFAAATLATATVARHLCRPEGADLSGALATLCETVGAPSGCLLEARRREDRADRTIVVATHGAVSSAFSRQVAARFSAAIDAESGVEDRSRARILTLPQLSAIGCLGFAGSFAIGLWIGEVEADDGVEDLLRTAIYLLSLSRGRSSSPRRRRRAPAAAALAWPEGYVPGTSAPMRELYRQMLAVAHGGLPVLILGETGVGKEYLARILHDSSPRREKALIAVNCAAIPAELLEAELFGVEKGAATGVVARDGTFQRAHRGTLFLDEIGDMSADLQAKLLRALQEREIRPVGGSTTRVDVRVIAATNADLERRIEAGSFRADLYYRLAGVVLEVPPLRRRRGDIADLVEHFLRLFAAEIDKSIRGVTVKALRTLIDYDWPGNVRELEHEIRRLVHLCAAGQAIDSALLTGRLRRRPSPPLPPAVAGEQASRDAMPIEDGAAGGSNLEASGDAMPIEDDDAGRLNLETLEKRAILDALDAAGGKKVAAARLLGISRDTLRRRLTRHGLAGPRP